jgi:selenide, water dikinase
VDLGHLLTHFARPDDPDLLVGFDTADDAGVYRVRDDLALVQTVDLITPVCDDPYRFGAVAAANALSDVYAMGGRPLTALNICCFPATGVPDGVFERILRGGWDKTREAGAVVVGGHTVRDQELKYGLAVTGTIDPARILRNTTAKPGDALVLTKPIGTGVMIQGSRKDLVPPERFERVVDRMARLNDVASELALSHGAHAATDVTGFGLAGHALEVARSSRVGIRVRAAALPCYEESLDLIARGVKTGVTESNRTLAGGDISFAGGIDEKMRGLFFDPQTSGGLLISLPAVRAGALVGALKARGVTEAAEVGEVFASPSAVLEVVP